MKLKVGDTVILKKNLKNGETYGGAEYWETMYFGEALKVESTECCSKFIRLEGLPFSYTEEMLGKINMEQVHYNVIRRVMDNMKFEKTLYVKGLLAILGLSTQDIAQDEELKSAMDKALAKHNLELNYEEE